MSEMLVHVLIQTAITFQILKSYRCFWIFFAVKGLHFAAVQTRGVA